MKLYENIKTLYRVTFTVFHGWVVDYKVMFTVLHGSFTVLFFTTMFHSYLQ